MWEGFGPCACPVCCCGLSWGGALREVHSLSAFSVECQAVIVRLSLLAGRM